MAQVSQITLNNVTFAQFRTDLNASLNALNTNHVGSSQPATAVEGTIWIGHYGGITKFDGEYFTTYTEKNGLLNNDVWKITSKEGGEG